MKSYRPIVTLRELREQPLWRLLAADRAPVIAGLLQTLLLDTDKILSGSVLLEKLTREIDYLRSTGVEIPQTPQAYIAEWLTKGWLSRRYPAGASEEEYELTVEAANALRFLASILKPRSAATESRLTTVIRQLERLAEETDTNPKSRLAALRAERERLDKEISAVESGALTPLEDERALERAREIIALADELTSDFRRVRDDFDKLNRSLRQSLMEHEGSRSTVLESMFAGVDVIGDTEAGRTFAAFWRLLTDPDQSSVLMDSLSEIASRPFARQLESQERKFLLNLTSSLINEGGGVHEVLQNFSRSLKTFVQSREFQEQRRLHSLLKQAQQAALSAKESARPNQAIDFSLVLTSSRVRSASQWHLYDPANRVTNTEMADAPPADLSMEVVSELLRNSEIDFRTLRANIREMLGRQSQTSIGQLLNEFPVRQGLGSVVGYIALGAKHGQVTTQTEIVTWESDKAGVTRARVPAIFFLREQFLEFTD